MTGGRRRREKIGAIEIERPALSGPEPPEVRVALQIAGLVETDLGPWRARVASAGLVADRDPEDLGAILDAVSRAMAAPSLDDPRDARAIEAAAVVAFALFDRHMCAAVEAGDANSAAWFGLALGRVIEGQRWRGSGADAAAVARQRQDAALTRATAARRKAPAWHEAAREAAAPMHARGWSANRAAEKLAGRFGKSSRAVATVIAPLWK